MSAKTQAVKTFEDKIKKAIKNRCFAVNNINEVQDEPCVQNYEFYFKDLEKNLICKMSPETRESYVAGSGGELKPPKMHAVHSSSAMTFNIFGNVDKPIEIKADSKLPKGKYKLEYERKLPAIKSPANMDACLTSDDNILLFEMKMTEWLLGQPKKLSATYLQKNNICLDETFREAMQELMRNYISEEEKHTDKKQYTCRTKRFDAFQIMLHIFAIYKAISKGEFPSGRNITLVIGYWTVPDENFFQGIELQYADYKKIENEMRGEIDEFIRIFEEIKKKFPKGTTINVRPLTVKEIIECLKKSPEEELLLKRYI